MSVQWWYTKDHDRVIDPMILVSLSDTIPPRATWTRQDSGEVMYTSVFNLATERFELLSELTPIDAAIDLGQGPRLKDNCFIHIRSGHLSRALGAGQKTLQSTQMADNEFAGSAYYNMGLISRDTGDSAAAIDWFKKSLMYRPSEYRFRGEVRLALWGEQTSYAQLVVIPGCHEPCPTGSARCSIDMACYATDGDFYADPFSLYCLGLSPAASACKRATGDLADGTPCAIETDCQDTYTQGSCVSGICTP